MNKNVEMMKKIIEDKKNQGRNTKNDRKAEKTIGYAKKGRKSGNGGGLFDK